MIREIYYHIIPQETLKREICEKSSCYEEFLHVDDYFFDGWKDNVRHIKKAIGNCMQIIPSKESLNESKIYYSSKHNCGIFIN